MVPKEVMGRFISVVSDPEDFANRLEEPESPYLLTAKVSSPILKIRRVVYKIALQKFLERDKARKLMQGMTSSTKSSGFHWYIEPDSAKYTVLRYSRAIGIFANLILIPSL